VIHPKRRYVVSIERTLKVGDESETYTTYLLRGAEVTHVDDATHWGAPSPAYDAMKAYGDKVAAKSPDERKGMFLDVVDLRAEKINQKAAIKEVVDRLLSFTDVAPPNDISKRELEYLLHRVEGKRTGEIADLMKISVKTASTYRMRLMEKLGLPDGDVSMAVYAIRVSMAAA